MTDEYTPSHLANDVAGALIVFALIILMMWSLLEPDTVTTTPIVDTEDTHELE